jgi:hypothetical protein
MLTIKAANLLAKSHGFGKIVTLPNGNSKLAKSKGYFNAGISLAQASLSGHNMCHGSTPQCRGACLGQTGRAEFFPLITQSRIARTKLYAENRDVFWSILETELHSVDRKAKKLGIPVAFRPNILSDQSWHVTVPQMFETFKHWTFYSYTKIKSKVSAAITGKLPENYHITYSWSERSNIAQVKKYLDHGVNVAVPFYDKQTLKPTIPQEWQGMPVINGDKSDLRFLDPKGVIVGLKTKLPKAKWKRYRIIKNSDGFFVGV